MLRIAYCSNVHAGSNFEQTRENLQAYSCQVKRHYSSDRPMGVGLWLSERTVSEIVANNHRANEFQQFLNDAGLVPFTFNGFPFGNFHQEVVKHDVYLPTWFDERRFVYTKNLVQLIHRFAPQGWEASISTLPIAWNSPEIAKEKLSKSGRLLRELASLLANFEKETGRLIYICIEPEPGCVLQYSKDVVNFFAKYLLRGGDEAAVRRHIRICHDVCHGVVMCESQYDILAAYHAAGLQVGKVQISSAVVVDFDSFDALDRAKAFQQLTEFAEDRYLHQTTVQKADAEPVFFEDLPLALQSVSETRVASGLWRIHFHIPVYLSSFGCLNASQQDIVDCVSSIREFSDVQHFEVETYAWNVLPPDLKQDDLAIGISDELQWFTKLASKHLD